MSVPADVAPVLVLATRNSHKVVELVRLLRPALPELADGAVLAAHELSAAGLPDPGEVPETGVTFAENALLKARTVAQLTGLPAVADDSGLCVAVLGGAPGVFSARWAGRHGDDRANLALLLGQLADVPHPHRTAWFQCAAALVDPRPGRDTPEVVVSGRLAGTLAHAPRGDGGFGYDPVLVPEGEVRTCAELSPADKDTISHRGQAVRALVPHVVAALQRR